MKYVKQKEWLLENISVADVRIIDCRFQLGDPAVGHTAYLEAHLPGSIYFDLEKDLSGEVKEHGGRHPLPNIDLLGEKLSDAGIDKQTIVVAYDNGEGAFASRFWWLLTYLGHKQVYVLDGGFNEWKNAAYPVTKEIATFPTVDFTPDIQTSMVASFEEVKEGTKLGGSVLLDSREKKRFTGQEEAVDPIAGRIPTAVHAPWADIFHQQRWKTTEELKQQFEAYQKNEAIIVYCGSGVTATPNILALLEADFENVKLYAGSYSDWISYKDNPVETGEV